MCESDSVDPAGGGPDEFTLSIAHSEDGTAIVDLVRGARGSPAAIVEDYADTLRGYGITRVTGDRYAGRWPRDEFKKHGIDYDVSDLDRSGLYLELLAAVNSDRVQLPPCPILRRQLLALERRTAARGRDLIDHPPGGSDDRANAVAGAVVLALLARRSFGLLPKKKYRTPTSPPKTQNKETFSWNAHL
jgi:hypothetical protein